MSEDDDVSIRIANPGLARPPGLIGRGQLNDRSARGHLGVQRIHITHPNQRVRHPRALGLVRLKMKRHPIASDAEVTRIRFGRIGWVGGLFLKPKDAAVIIFSPGGVGNRDDGNGAGDHDEKNNARRRISEGEENWRHPFGVAVPHAGRLCVADDSRVEGRSKNAAASLLLARC